MTARSSTCQRVIATVPLKTLPAGTVLYHGTSARSAFKHVRGPGWFALTAGSAKKWAQWGAGDSRLGGGEIRVLKYRTKRSIPLLDTRDVKHWDRLGDALRMEPTDDMRRFAKAAAACGNGWFGRVEFMLGEPRRWLSPQKAGR